MGWITGTRGPRRIRRKPVVAEARIEGRVVIPAFDFFLLSEVHKILGVPRATVFWWTKNGKLMIHRSFSGTPYVIRIDLIDFIRSYLGRECD